MNKNHKLIKVSASRGGFKDHAVKKASPRPAHLGCGGSGKSTKKGGY